MATPIPQNNAAFSFAEIQSVTGARASAAAAVDLQRSVSGVSTDSRESLRGKLFVALRGDRFDGNRFVDAAFAAGAAAVLLEGVPEEQQTGAARPVFWVRSSLDALGALARFHRVRWGGTVVAVVGSAGKTTTKSAIAALLNACVEGGVHTTPGNLNNRIGVPMVLLGLKPEQRVAVVEVGTNVRGEVATLASVVEPDIAVLTLIALEHAAGIGSIDEVEAEEGDLLAHSSVRRFALANGDDVRACRQLERALAMHKRSYGFSQHCDYRIVERSFLGGDGSRFSFVHGENPTRKTTVSTSLIGDPGALATLAAIAVAESIGNEPVSAELVNRVFSRRDIGEAGRLRPIELSDGTLLLDDSYNANPASIRAAIEVARQFAAQRSARLVLVLGEMRELGDFSVNEHVELAGPVQASGAAALLAVAGDCVRLAAASRDLGTRSEFANDANEALPLCRLLVQARDVVLFKGSRGVKLETLIHALVEERGLAA
jgi:UDP-N-acetylmuramoyl-tripeptide--D-alanyl-D-alanine ligase